MTRRKPHSPALPWIWQMLDAEIIFGVSSSPNPNLSGHHEDLARFGVDGSRLKRRFWKKVRFVEGSFPE